MKYLLLILWLVAPIIIPDGSDLQRSLISECYAGTTCSTDMFGVTHCSDNNGYTWTGSKDMFGTTTWRDNQGNTTRCTKDMFGTTRCN